MEIVREKVRYRDERGYRVVDLRPDGVGCIPVCSCRTGRAVAAAPALHVHPGVIELCYCVRGMLAFETPERVYSFLPGSVFTSRETEPHRMMANPKGLFVYRILVKVAGSGGRLGPLGLEDSAWLRERLMNLPRRYFVRGKGLESAFERLFAAYDDRSADPARRRIELRRRALDVMLAFVDAAGQGVSRQRHPQIVRWVREMERNPLKEYPLHEMAESTGQAPAAFAKLFKEVAGLPPQAYLCNCRIRHAAGMLDAGKSVMSVALAHRFSSAQYFATVFKAVMGVTPREWRKRSK